LLKNKERRTDLLFARVCPMKSLLRDERGHIEMGMVLVVVTITAIIYIASGGLSWERLLSLAVAGAIMGGLVILIVAIFLLMEWIYQKTKTKPPTLPPHIDNNDHC
jgi:p-aminobenzoyl-glutamate transporter AbgT